MHLDGHRIRYLLSMQPRSRESYMFHHPNTWLVELISKSTGIPLVRETTLGRKEEELRDLRRLIQRVAGDVQGIVTGAIGSAYQKSRIDCLCRELSLRSVAPLWHREAGEMWRELFDLGFKVMITAVAAEGLDETWLGRVVDRSAYKELERLSRLHRFHLGFEGGEAETLVLDMPLYRKVLEIEDGEPVWEGSSGFYLIKRARLADR